MFHMHQEAPVATAIQDYRAVFISDTHLGFKGAKARHLADFLDQHHSDDLSEAVRRALACDRSRVREHAERFTWGGCAATLRDALEPNDRWDRG